MLPKIPNQLLKLYEPVSVRESLYLRIRWRLCPFELIESLLPRTGKTFDFGCGYGILANLIALRGSDRPVVGIDMNAKRIEVAKRSIKNRNNINFHPYGIESLEIDNYKAVILTDVAHHIDDKTIKTILEKINSCLQDEGMLIILDVNRIPLWKFYITYVIDKSLNLKNRIYYRSLQDIQFLLKDFPLTLERIIPAHKGFPLSDILYVYRKKLP